MKIPKIYLSGYGIARSAQKEYHDWTKRAGVTHCCFNFAYLHPKAFAHDVGAVKMYDISVKNKIGIMMDSSAFSFRKWFAGKAKKNAKLTENDLTRLCDETIKHYVEFCKKDSRKWDFYVNFDYIRDCKVIWKMQEKLEAIGISPAPVFHGDDTMDWFRRYLDKGYDLICIGNLPSRGTWKNKRDFFDRIFTVAEPYKVKLHGLAFTSLSFMLDYPWWSVDSATHVKSAAFGLLVFPDQERNVIHTVHVSEKHSNNRSSYNRMPKEVKEEIHKRVESAGFDFDKVRTHLYDRTLFNAWVFCHLDKLLVNHQSTKPEWEKIFG